MNPRNYFSISRMGSALHTPETKAIWESWGKNKSNHGRLSIIKFAKAKGFLDVYETKLPDKAEKAFQYLIECFPGATKSYLIKIAIVDYRHDS